MSSELERYKKKSEQPQDNNPEPKLVKADIKSLGDEVHSRKVHVEAYDRNERVTYVVDAENVPIERTEKTTRKDGNVIREVIEKVYDPITKRITTKHDIEETKPIINDYVKYIPPESTTIERKNIEKKKQEFEKYFENQYRDMSDDDILDSIIHVEGIISKIDLIERINTLEKKLRPITATDIWIDIVDIKRIVMYNYLLKSYSHLLSIEPQFNNKHILFSFKTNLRYVFERDKHNLKKRYIKNLEAYHEHTDYNIKPTNWAEKILAYANDGTIKLSSYEKNWLQDIVDEINKDTRYYRIEPQKNFLSKLFG